MFSFQHVVTFGDVQVHRFLIKTFCCCFLFYCCLVAIIIMIIWKTWKRKKLDPSFPPFFIISKSQLIKDNLTVYLRMSILSYDSRHPSPIVRDNNQQDWTEAIHTSPPTEQRKRLSCRSFSWGRNSTGPWRLRPPKDLHLENPTWPHSTSPQVPATRTRHSRGRNQTPRGEP